MRSAVILLAALLLALPACRPDAREVERKAAEMTGGDPERGRAAIRQHGCGSCHTIPGIDGANALVGPPLNQVASRTYIAGVLTNTSENMLRWIQDPPGVDPRTAMPNLHLGDAEVRDIASYLYTLE